MAPTAPHSRPLHMLTLEDSRISKRVWQSRGLWRFASEAQEADVRDARLMQRLGSFWRLCGNDWSVRNIVTAFQGLP
jgi:hypothetical protein